MPTNDFLLEIGVEEIPDWMIEPALGHLRTSLAEAFENSRLRCGDAPHIETYATPRRLVAYVPDIPARQPDSEQVLTGPPVKAPEQARDSFAKKAGVPASELHRTTTPKGEYWSYVKKEKGRETAAILAAVLPGIIEKIYFPKTMYWTGKTGVRFIRPIRSLLALYAGRVIRFEVAGVESGACTFGHRTLGKSRLKVTGFQQYSEALAQNGVVLRAGDRRERILSGASALLEQAGRQAQHGGTPAQFTLRDNPGLVRTLVYLTEFPTPEMGSFDPSYLDLPEEVLVTVMQHHQKYLSVSDGSGKLAPRFIFVMNIGGDASGVIRHGNERVLRARFNDARFFWETDQKIPLRDRLPMLEHVTFQAKLGSYREKTKRTMNLVERLAPVWSQPSGTAVRAAELAKTDLTTELVKEFTELQGVVGGLYAKAQGEPPEVADAIYDQYKPESTDAASPRTKAGALLAVADKLDTLAGCFSIGLKPTGSSDPFALRRAAQGVVKILADHTLHASVANLVRLAVTVQNPAHSTLPAEETARELREFFLDRLRYYLREVRGFAYDEVNAVLAVRADDVMDAIQRCEALRQVRPTPDFEPLSAAFKRIKNILAKAGGLEAFPGEPEAALLEPGAETDLHNEARRVFEQTQAGAAYADALLRVAALRPVVDNFFDRVLVMAPDENIRRNRLTMLAWLLRAFTRVADFSEIVVQQ